MAAGPKTLKWWYEQLADWMILNPSEPLKSAAAIFKVTPNYLYLIKNSDAFREYWEARRKRQEDKVSEVHIDRMIGVREKITSLADMALDNLMESLEEHQRGARVGAPQLSHDALLETANMALQKLNYGVPALPSGGGNAQVNVTINSDLLANAREKMKEVYGIEGATASIEKQKVLELEAAKQPETVAVKE